MSCYNIMALLIDRRSKNAVKIQEVLTEYGCIIRMRLGLHESGDACSEEGLVVLQVCGTDKDVKELENALNAVEGTTVKTMSISSH